MSPARKGGALLLAALLAACSQSAPAAAPHRSAGIDKQAIAAAIKQRLENRPWFGGLGSQHRCGEAFTISLPTITNQHIEGATGEVEATMMITSLRDWPERSDPTDGCFGAPAGGFRAGQAMTIIRRYPVQKWDSGWQLGPGQ